ncbi:MAG: serine/threonine-protein kinase, partial [Planctomycetota bacterium]
QVLASLTHPAIATIHRTGTATHPSGAEVPYIVMELIRGESITSRAAELDASDRLQLLASVARGVQAAHQSGIIHRDLKPGNILVDPELGPKILDFGIARLLDDAQGSVHTATGEVLGTLTYMSPEQIDPRLGRLDTRGDVYSLGVLMYELLVGEPAVLHLDRSPFDIASTIIKGELPKLDTRGLGLHTDADAVYRKATATDPERRYASAAAFADDLDRLAEGRPVTAQAPTTYYLLRTFARRNPLLVGMVASVFVAVSLFGTLAAIGFVSASRERDAAIEARAETSRERDAAIEARARLESSYEFLRSMLASADPEIDGPNVRVVDLLDRWSRTIDDGSIGDPAVQVDLHRTVGWTYASLSLHEKALSHFETGRAMAAALSSPNELLLANLDTDTANSLVHVGESPRAVELARGVVERVVAEDRETTATRVAALIALGEAQRLAGTAREAIETLREAVELSEADLPVGDENTRSALSALGRSYLELSLAEDAVAIYEHLVDISKDAIGEQAPDTLRAMGNLGTALGYAGEFERSVELFESTIEPMAEVLGDEHYDVRTFRGNMVDVLVAVGRGEEALALAESVVATERRIGGEAHQDTVTALNNYAAVLMQLERYDEARSVTTDLVRLSNLAYGEDHPRAMIALRTHAAACELTGDEGESLRIQESLLVRQQQLLGPTEWDTLLTHNNLGFLLNKLGRGDEAVEHLRFVVEHTGPGSGYPAFLHAVINRTLAKCLVTAGQLDEAASVLAFSRSLDPDNEDHQQKCDAVQATIDGAR